jgi:hypothetical protein
MKGFLSKNVKIMTVQDPLTSGSTTNSLGSATVDMTGFDSVLFVSTVGLTTTAVTLTAQAASSTTASDFADITSATCNSTASNGVLYVDVKRVTKRYMRTTLNSTGSNVNGGTIAILYDAHAAPTTNASTDVLTSAAVVST